MGRPSPTRVLGELTFADVAKGLTETSILCLPLGATEQHGSHLPLNTDSVIAEGLTRCMVARWGEEFDLWQLPALTLGLSHEHDWAAGTLSLSVTSFVALMRDLVRDIARSLPARNLAIVNGHGGNRGILESLLREFAGDFALNACAIHPFDLSKADTGSTIPDVHGGRSETSVMLALAPELVRTEAIESPGKPADPDTVQSLIFDRGVTWPWRTDDARLARSGIIGDPRGASAELGNAIIASIVEEARGVFVRLLDNQKLMRGQR